MTSPPSAAQTQQEPLAAAPPGPDPLEQALSRARSSEGAAQEREVLETWLDLRNLLRAKRPEQALTVLERWQADLHLDGEDQSPSSVAPAQLAGPPRSAAQVRAALADPALPEHVRALVTLRRWQTPAEAQQALAGAQGHPLTRAEAWNLLGVLAAETGETALAADAFARALAADPGHYRALTNRAGLATERGEDAAAEADLRRALELNADHHAAWQNLAVILRRQGKRSEAVQALKRAQRLDYRTSGKRGDDQARRELAGLHRVPRAVWLVAALLLFAVLWLWGAA